MQGAWKQPCGLFQALVTGMLTGLGSKHASRSIVFIFGPVAYW